MKKKSLLLSCDWGTSNFRIQLVDVESKKILSAKTSDKGIAKVYSEWRDAGQKGDRRIAFYYQVIDEHIRNIEQELSIDLKHVAVVISGMASASIGMMELPYSNMPFSMDSSNVLVEKVGGSGNILRDVFIISGVRTEEDVMRGEETQLIGCFEEVHSLPLGYFIFPGTHSKHVIIENGKAVSIKTFMTGEFFDLLSQKSILASSIEKSALNIEAFKKGVAESINENILHTSFLARTNQIFDKLPKQENYHFLSGLLIGYELKQVLDSNLSIFIVADAYLNHLYKEAVATINPSILVNTIEGTTALLQGQLKIWKRLSEAKSANHF